MSKVFGKTERYQLINTQGNRTIVSYGIERVDEVNSTWHEVDFPKAHGEKPSIEQVKKAIIADIDAETQKAIIEGFVWNGKPVWLSIENQANFTAAEHRAQTDEDYLPRQMKIGEDGDGAAVYHTFKKPETLTAFLNACLDYIEQCRTAGWEKKDSFDFTEYETVLKNDTLQP